MIDKEREEQQQSSVPITSAAEVALNQVASAESHNRSRWVTAVCTVVLVLFLVYDPVNLFQTHSERLNRAREAFLGGTPSPDAPMETVSTASGAPLGTASPPVEASPQATSFVDLPAQVEYAILQGKVTSLPKSVVLRAIDPSDPLKDFAPRLTKSVVRRQWTNATAQKPRVLQTEVFAQKYGLTNILMSMAAMMAYGSADDRAIHFPSRSPVKVEDLVDLAATEELLRPTNVVLLTDAEFDAHYAREKPVKARKLGLSFGYRNIIGSKELDVATRAFAAQRDGMRASRSITVLNHRDFFLSFPFRATAPLDLCFYLRRMVYHQLIRHTASALLKALKDKSKARTYMALHLRLEGDVRMLRKQATSLTPAKLEAFIRTKIMPVVKAARIDTVYVCAGAIPAAFINVFRTVDFGVKFYFKSDFPDLHVPVVAENVTVTSHVGASVDALMLKHSAVSVTFKPSTFTTNVIAVRCPSPARGTTEKDVKASLRLLTWDDLGLSGLVAPPPGDFTLAPEFFAKGNPPPFEGILTYDFTEEGDFSDLEYVSCEDQFNWCRFK